MVDPTVFLKEEALHKRVQDSGYQFCRAGSHHLDHHGPIAFDHAKREAYSYHYDAEKEHYIEMIGSTGYTLRFNFWQGITGSERDLKQADMDHQAARLISEFCYSKIPRGNSDCIERRWYAVAAKASIACTNLYVSLFQHRRGLTKANERARIRAFELTPRTYLGMAQTTDVPMVDNVPQWTNSGGSQAAVVDYIFRHWGQQAFQTTHPNDHYVPLPEGVPSAAAMGFLAATTLGKRVS